MRRLQQIFIPAGGQHRGHQRFTDLTTVAVSIAGNQLFEGADMVDAYQVIDLLPRPRKVLADILFDFNALPGKLVLHHLFHQRAVRQRRDPERLRRAALQRRKDQTFRVFG